MDTTTETTEQVDATYNHRAFEGQVSQRLRAHIEAWQRKEANLAHEWAEVEELAADIAEDLGLLHTHPVAVLTVLHDRARGQR